MPAAKSVSWVITHAPLITLVITIVLWGGFASLVLREWLLSQPVQHDLVSVPRPPALQATPAPRGGWWNTIPQGRPSGTDAAFDPRRLPPVQRTSGGSLAMNGLLPSDGSMQSFLAMNPNAEVVPAPQSSRSGASGSPSPAAPPQTPQQSAPARASLNPNTMDLSRLPGSSSLISDKQPIQIDLPNLIRLTLQNSHQVRVQRLGVGIERTNPTRADAEFDWNMFVENAFSRINQSEGANFASTIDQRNFQNFLDNGVASDDQLIQTSFIERAGFRTLTRGGGELSLSAERSDLRSDGSAGVAEQGTTQLVFRLSHELLRGAGREATENTVVQAHLEAEVNAEEVFATVTELVQRAANAYWNLYFARGEVLVRRQLLDEGIRIREEMIGRSDIDAEVKLIARTTAAIEGRRAALSVAYQSLTNNQNELLRIVNAPEADLRFNELLPVQPAEVSPMLLDFPQELQQGLQNRGEVVAAITRISAATTQNRVAKNLLLPRLAMVLESRLFEINSDEGDAIAAGLTFEYPLGNRSALAASRRAELELARRGAEYQDVVAQVENEIRVALAQVQTSMEVLRMRQQQIEAAEMDLAYQQERRRIAPVAGSIPAYNLDQLLSAQQAVANARVEYLDTVRNLNIGLLQLAQAKGVLIQRF